MLLLHSPLPNRNIFNMLTEFFNFAFSEMKKNPVNPLQLIIIINKLFYNCSIIRENAFGRRKKTKKRTAKQNMRSSQRLLFINTDIIRGIKPTWDFPIYKIYLFFWHIRQENHNKGYTHVNFVKRN